MEQIRISSLPTRNSEIFDDFGSSASGDKKICAPHESVRIAFFRRDDGSANPPRTVADLGPSAFSAAFQTVSTTSLFRQTSIWAKNFRRVLFLLSCYFVKFLSYFLLWVSGRIGSIGGRYCLIAKFHLKRTIDAPVDKSEINAVAGGDTYRCVFPMQDLAVAIDDPGIDRVVVYTDLHTDTGFRIGCSKLNTLSRQRRIRCSHEMIVITDTGIAQHYSAISVMFEC